MINNDNDNNLYLKRVTQSNGKNLLWVPLPRLQVGRGPQAYKSSRVHCFKVSRLEGR